MGEGPEPHAMSSRVRSGISFGLTLVVVIVVGALGGYVLGRYVFDRLMTGDTVAQAPRSVATAPSRGPATGPEPAPAVTAPQASSSSRATAPPPPSPAPTPVPAAGGGASFFVQVGAFGSSERAADLAQQLRQQGLPVVVETQSGNPVLYKVRVGPYARREDAVQVLQRLKPTMPDAFIP